MTDMDDPFWDSPGPYVTAQRVEYEQYPAEKKPSRICDCGHGLDHHTADGWCDVCQFTHPKARAALASTERNQP